MLITPKGSLIFYCQCYLTKGLEINVNCLEFLNNNNKKKSVRNFILYWNWIFGWGTLLPISLPHFLSSYSTITIYWRPKMWLLTMENDTLINNNSNIEVRFWLYWLYWLFSLHFTLTWQQTLRMRANQWTSDFYPLTNMTRFWRYNRGWHADHGGN